jgi:hypothetical protein
MNKTCGECKHYIAEMYHCSKYDVMAEAQNTCEDFDPKVITNDDKIIAGGMRAIAELAKKRCQHSIYKTSDFEAVCFEVDCADGIEAWLNSPAESEEG